ncbi:MAG: tRNA 4-thiouridine(8) synthase ThiI [Deltaproteobacteria bacterium]|nr:tRNA 4-thiouridine(8) synthase ThiI [Deltaproteobacteria bacterium]MBW2068199.1 tRNA 4-thiouridine(8) synthase ThiI [Deltaproteobacteria bacterium]
MRARKRSVKGIGLISGGLDSLLAAKILQEQGVDVLGITFTTPFWDCSVACASARDASIPVRVVDISVEHLEVVKNPVYGYGSNMNPCIDCHGLMIRIAGRIMEEEGADFIFTGEVVGQRPMSQRMDALRSVEKLSGYGGRVLRPLSAKLLPETEVEKLGLVDRSRLLAIQGRSRKKQIELARLFGLKTFSPPGGGCLLTKEGFSSKLRKLLGSSPNVSVRHIEMLKAGRFFILPGNNCFFLGRNHMDNMRLQELADLYRETLFVCKGVPGPKGLLLSTSSAEDVVKLAAIITASFSDASPGQEVMVEWRNIQCKDVFQIRSRSRQEFDDLMIR